MPELSNLDVEWVSLVNRAAVRDPVDQDQPMRFLVWKSDTDPKGDMMDEATMTAAVEKAEAERDEARNLVEIAKSERAELATHVDELEKAAAKPNDDPDDDEKEEVDKSDLSPAVRRRLEKLEKAEEDAKERVEKAESLAKAERDIRVNREFVQKAEQFGSLSQDPLELGPVLKAAHDSMPEEQYTVLETVLKAADDQVRQSGLFKEQGRGGEGRRESGDSFEKLQKAAQELRKSDPSMTAEAALDAAMQADPDMQAQYLAENR
jgi:hypothetical protein